MMDDQDARYRALAQSAVDAIITADASGTIVGWNHSAEMIFGYTEAEALGQSLTMLMPADFRHEHSVGMARVQSGGEKHVIGKTVEMRGLRKDGRSFPIEMSLAEWQVDGNQFYTAIIRDISERKRIEGALRLSEEKFHKAFQSSPDAILLTRARDGSFVEVNDSFSNISGYTREEALASTTLNLELWVDLRDREACLAALQEHGHIRDQEYCFRAKSGRIIRALYSGEIIAIGGEAHVLSVIRDITERKELEQQRDDLIHMLVHDLRNPLANIQTSLDLLIDNPSSTIQGKLLRIASNNTRNMLTLVNEILVVSQLEEKRLPLDRTWVDLPDLVDIVFLGQCTLADEKNLQLQNRVPADLPAVLADRRIMERVFQNLIGNAIKFTSPGGVIRVNAGIDVQYPGYLLVSVYNSGADISPEIRAHLFQKFVAGRVTGRGSGLGLAFARLAIEAHGGQIWVASKPQEEHPPANALIPETPGVTFLFTLPLTAA